MEHVPDFRYLNLADTWPGFDSLRGVMINPDGGLTLIRVPAVETVFGTVPTSLAGSAEPAGLSSDGVQYIYLADPVLHRICRVDTCGAVCEDPIRPVAGFGGEGQDPGQLRRPRSVLVAPPHTLYVADTGNHRIQVFNLSTGQVSGIWGQLTGTSPQPGAAVGRFNEPWDLAADPSGAIYVMERAGQRVQKFDAAGTVDPTYWEQLRATVSLGVPVALATGVHEGTVRLYLLDADLHEVLVCTPEGTLYGRWALPASITPVGIATGETTVFVGDAGTGQIFQFDTEGHLLGKALGYQGLIAGLMRDADGSLLVHPGGCTGVAWLAPRAGYVSEGAFLAGPFDSGAARTTWHRLRVAAPPLPVEAHLELFTCTDDTPTTRTLAPEPDPFPETEGWRAAPLDALDLLILNPPARYLWIGGRLQGNGRVSPALMQMQVTYPPDTYLRYLPSIYREDARHRPLLERVLALFESVLGGLEEQVHDLTLLFDPFAIPPDWLPWLANWLALPLDASWSEAHTRQAVADAFAMYGMRGTVEGLRRMLKQYAGVEAFIEEPSVYHTLWTLGEMSALGFGTVLAPAPVQGAVLDTTATLDGSYLIAKGARSAPVFADRAHRFVVWVYRADLKRSGVLDAVKEVLDREKPAHTDYHLCVMEPRFRVGFQARIGIDTIIGDAALGFKLDQDQPLGLNTMLFSDEETLLKGAETPSVDLPRSKL